MFTFKSKNILSAAGDRRLSICRATCWSSAKLQRI